MKKLAFEWVLREEGRGTVERYCAHCGRKAIFHDSLLRRVNANGKDLYEFAIYKCERDHTWNKVLGKTKAGEGKRENGTAGSKPNMKIDRIDLQLCEQEDVQVIEIFLREVVGKWRLDKLLARQIEGWSRAWIERLIDEEAISVVGRKAETGTFVKTGDLIRILIPNA